MWRYRPVPRSKAKSPNSDWSRRPNGLGTELPSCREPGVSRSVKAVKVYTGLRMEWCYLFGLIWQNVLHMAHANLQLWRSFLQRILALWRLSSCAQMSNERHGEGSRERDIDHKVVLILVGMRVQTHATITRYGWKMLNIWYIYIYIIV